MDVSLVALPLYVLWGLIVGLMVGFTAIGTGLLGTPGLIIFFGLEPVMAVGTMGLAGVMMMSSGVVQHIREKNVEWRVCGIFAITALPASYLCANYADAINRRIPAKAIIGGVILVSTVLLFYRYVIMKPRDGSVELPGWKWIAAPFMGLGLGALMGATSISGSIIVIVFLLVLKLPEPIAIGSTSALAAVSLAVAAIAHVSQAHIRWDALIGLVPGVMAGAALGARYVKRVPRQLLRYSILVILAVAGMMVILKG